MRTMSISIHNYKNKDKGFIALTSLLLISSILFILLINNSIENGTFFDQVTKKIYRKINYYNAISCLNYAYLMISYDFFFSPKQPYDIKEFNCKILSVKINGNEREVETLGYFKDANVYINKTITVSDDGRIINN